MKSDTTGVYISRLMELELERTVLLTRLKLAAADQQSGAPSRDIVELYVNLNVFVDSILSLVNPEGRDLINVLPPELWGRCVVESLPEYGRFAALITLTLVSNRWRDAILSTPVLWAQVHVNGYDEDSLATIATSLHLSKGADLYLTIWKPIHHNWDATIQLLKPHKHRLRRISVYISPQEDNQISNRRSEDTGTLYLWDVGLIMDLFDGGPPNDLSIRLGTPRVAEVRPIAYAKSNQLQSFWMAKHWCVSAPIFHRLSMLLPYRSAFHHLAYLRLHMSPNDFFSRVAQLRIPKFPRLGLLEFSSAQHEDAVDIKLPAPTLDYFPALRDLKCTSLSLAQPGMWEIFLATFRTIRSLHISIPYEEVPRLAGILQVMSALEILSLRLELRLALIDPRYASPGAFGEGTIAASLFKVSPPISHVSQLKVVFYLVDPILYPDAEEELQDTNLPVGQMIESFLTFLVKLKAAAFTCYSGHTRTLFPNFWGCKALESLKMRGFRYAAHSAARTSLPDLYELDYDDKIPPISVPVLLNLSIDWIRLPRDLSSMKLSKVRELTIRAGNTKDTIRLHPEVYESLIKLRIERLLPRDEFKLISLPSLTRIEIVPKKPYTTHCTELCASLLFDPEFCPMLQELVFGESPEWDILRLMLEARNFQPSSHVSRIRRVTVPHINDEFRIYFSSLLAGRYPPDSISLVDLSFEAERQRLYDQSRLGCFACLRHGLGPCEEVISRSLLYFWELSPYNLQRIADRRRTTAEVLAWASTREMFRLEWTKSSNEFQPQVLRKSECPRRTACSAIEIGEFEWMEEASI